MANENETMSLTDIEADFGKIVAILDTSAGDRLKENVLKRLYPSIFGDRTAGRPGLAEEAFAAASLSRESPVYHPTEAKAGPVAPARPSTFPNPKKLPPVSEVVNTPARGYSPGENILKPVDREKEEMAMRGVRFEDEPAIAKKDAALAHAAKPTPVKKPAQEPVDEEAERITLSDKVYIPVASVARRSGGVHPRAIAHRCDKLGFKCVKNPKGTGMMIIEKDALAVIASFNTK